MGDDILLPPLGSPAAGSPETAGSKAAGLSSLRAAGFPVPAGFVVTDAAFGALQGQAAGAETLEDAARAAGPGPYAVRSSAAAEDLPGASFAGMYETFLNVAPADLFTAVERCFDSANADRIRAYESSITSRSAGGTPGSGASAMAVLVQQMVDPAAAGVAFTANPLTGDRTETVLSAVPGLADGLVSGLQHGEEWIIGAERPVQTRGTGGVLSVESATAVAAAAARVARYVGGPQDIEWAMDHAGTVHILQARPMTALPDPVRWAAPGKGSWLRNFRLGEWLPEPVTPLFMDWVIPELDAAYNRAVRTSAGIDVPMGHAQINGWYYVSPPTPLALPHVLFGSAPRAMPFFFNAVVRPIVDPAGADRSVLRALEQEWRTECLPAYRHLAETSSTVTATATVPELMDLVEQVVRKAGEYLWFFAATGGAAWKMEMALARFWRRHLADALAARALPGFPETPGYQTLLGGLSSTAPGQVPYAVYSIDWYHPTAGEQFSPTVPLPGADAQPAPPPAAVARRRAVEAACCEVLTGSRRLKRFKVLLDFAQRYARLREEQVRDFTLGWPLLRRCAAELGARLQDRGIITGAGDVYFLKLDALRDDASPQQANVERRRKEWLRQRKLAAPLTLGKLPPLLGNAFDRLANAARSTTDLPAGALVGHPASPGRAQGRVRVVEGPEDFARFLPGEVLVAKATAPAWTPLFANAAAVVTDGGSLAAHASLIAREYGIPAVVGTGNATHILKTGQWITVDGSAGTVELHDG